MAKATLTIEDQPDGTVTVQADFGETYDQESQAHGMIVTLAESVLRIAKTYTTIEDTAPEADIEPTKIITIITTGEANGL